MRVLVVGAGKTGELAARHFRERTCSQITLANRTRAKAEDLADEIGCQEVIDFEQVRSVVDEFDIVVSAVEGGVRVLSAADVGPRERPLHLVDLSMPPSLDPHLADVTGVDLIDIESLQGVVTTTTGKRLSAVPEAEALIAEAMGTAELKLWEDSALKPMLANMNAKITDMLSEIFPSLERHLVEAGAERLVNMHVRKIKQIRDSVDGRRAQLEALMAVYAAPEEHSGH